MSYCVISFSFQLSVAVYHISISSLQFVGNLSCCNIFCYSTAVNLSSKLHLNCEKNIIQQSYKLNNWEVLYTRHDLHVSFSVCGISELLDILCGAGRIDSETAAKVRQFLASANEVKVPQSKPCEDGGQPCKKQKKVKYSILLLRCLSLMCNDKILLIYTYSKYLVWGTFIGCCKWIN